MSTSTLALDRSTGWLARATDYVELTKPRIGALVLVAVAASGFVARWGRPDPVALLNALLGTLLVAASASALNQWWERRSDILMDRTASRPLPAGRLRTTEVVGFALLTFVAGGVYLAVAVNGLTAIWSIFSWFVYVWVYTPLKARSSLNTAVGAVAGAMPVLIGWSAVGGSLDLTADPRVAALFVLLFLWQFPHFMAIAWIYRQQYARAGLKMLTVVDPSGRRAGVQALVSALGLLPVSFIPALFSPGIGGSVYLVAAFVLGLGQLVCAVHFMVRRDELAARRLLRASLIYLPVLLGFLVSIPFA